MERAHRARDRDRGKFLRGLTDGLLAFARAHFALTVWQDEKKKTRLQEFLEIREQTGIVAPELQSMPPLPLEVEHLWSWFSDLDRQRGAGFSVNALAWSDIAAYFQLKRIRPHDWEVRAIQELDQAFIQSRVKNVAVDAADAKGLKDRMTGAAAREGNPNGRRNRRSGN